MSSTVSFFDAMGDGFVVGSDSFLDQIVTWNGSSTFSVFYHWGKDRWEEIDCFTKYSVYSLADARAAARDYFTRVYEEAAAEAEHRNYAEA